MSLMQKSILEVLSFSHEDSSRKRLCVGHPGLVKESRHSIFILDRYSSRQDAWRDNILSQCEKGNIDSMMLKSRISVSWFKRICTVGRCEIAVVQFGNLQTGRTTRLCSPGNKSKRSMPKSRMEIGWSTS